MDILLDLRVLAVVVPSPEDGVRIFTMRNAEAQRRAVYTPIDEIVAAPDTITDRVYHVPVQDANMSIEDFLLLSDEEKEQVLRNIHKWINHD